MVMARHLRGTRLTILKISGVCCHLRAILNLRQRKKTLLEKLLTKWSNISVYLQNVQPFQKFKTALLIGMEKGLFAKQ